MWELALSSMKKGEKCIIIGTSEYGYGLNGSPPIIPGDSCLYFELELLDIKNKEKEIFEMNTDEKIEKMLFYKNKGIIEFNNKNIKLSYNLFKKSLDYLSDEIHYEKINILNNLSMISGKLENWIESYHYSIKAYNISKKNIKVLYRLAMSNYKLNNFNDCINICKKAIKIENNNMINSLYRNSIKSKNDELEKTKKMYKKMF